MILTLSSESVRNTVFVDESGLPVFKSNTPMSLGARTTIVSRPATQSAGEGGIGGSAEVAMGSIEWHWVGSSKFTVGRRQLESEVFLKSEGNLGRKFSFTGPDGRRYRWEMSMTDVVLLLDDGSETEIARYHRAAVGIINKRRSYLEIIPQAEDVLNLIILTFIYVEKLWMDRERRRDQLGVLGGGH